jgi:hypothetical protein
MKQLVGPAGVLLATSAGAGQPGRFAMPRWSPHRSMPWPGITVQPAWSVKPVRATPVPKLEVTITPPKVKIPDNSKRGTRLAKVTVRWNNGEAFSGEVRLTKNSDGICQLSGMELQLGRETTKGDDYKTSVCTVMAIK